MASSMYVLLVFSISFLHLIACVPIQSSRPHIFFILGDDIGYNDVGWHNEKISTPFMNSLAKTGVILENYYSFTQCTPSRASLLTGYYSQSLGIQRWVLGSTEPYGVPLRFKMLPARLREVGYTTHAAGKWHIGYCDWRYTPTYRGFQDWIGFYNGAEENIEHCIAYFLNRTSDGQCQGFDFRDGEEPARSFDGQYSGEIYTKRVLDIIDKYNEDDGPLFVYVALTDTHFPLQAPERFYEQCSNQSVNQARENFCAAMAAIDESIKNITNAIKEKGLYDNSVIIFASDNGGTTHFGGNNYPFRGEKGTLYEGGGRVPAFLHSPLLEKTGYVNENLIQVSDWAPTIMRLAGAESDPDMDGVDQWDCLSRGASSTRMSLPYLVDSSHGVLMAAVRNERYKFISGPAGRVNEVVTEEDTIDNSYNSPFLMGYTNPYYLPIDLSDTEPKLYDLLNDPSEKSNLAKELPDVMKEMQALLDGYVSRSRPAMAVKADPRGNPLRFNNTVTPGWCQAVYDVPTATDDDALPT